MDKTVLRRLTGEVKQRQIATLDLEAREWVLPYAVGFYDGKNYIDFVNDNGACVADSLIHILVPDYSAFWIYAHNGGNYDFLFLVRAMLSDPRLKSKYLTELTPIGSCIVRMDITERDPKIHLVDCENLRCRGCGVARDTKETKLKWTFVDSARLMPLPLKDLGETFGITQKVELQMSYDDLAKPENRGHMRHYLRVDCVSLHEAVSKMQEKINGLGGQLGITLPATALDLFRRKFQKDDVSTNRHWKTCPEYGVVQKKGVEVTCKGCMHDFIRQSYFGGRSEIFRMKFSPYDEKPSDEEFSERVDHIDHAFMYDFNSHYPNMMLAAMPTGEAIELEGLDEQAIYNNAKQFTGIVDCDVDVPDGCYLPPLPVRHAGKLVFPTGRLRGVWDASEIALLPLVGGRVITSRRSLWFENSPIFVRIVRALYRFRDKKLAGWTKGMDWIAKILLNSLYGKFGMKEMRSRILVNPDSPQGMKCIDLESDVWGEEVYVSPSYIVPQLSVHVTALARVGLWKMLDAVIKKGGRIYYTDTDSIVCSGVELPTGGDLGALKQEAIIRRAEFVLPKLYLVETDVPIDRHRLTKLREGLNDYAKKVFEFPRVIASPKALKTEYDKRIVLPDYDTRPLRLEQY